MWDVVITNYIKYATNTKSMNSKTYVISALGLMICCFSLASFVILSGIAGQRQALAVAQGVDHSSKHLGPCGLVPGSEGEKDYYQHGFGDVGVGKYLTGQPFFHCYGEHHPGFH